MQDLVGLNPQSLPKNQPSLTRDTPAIAIPAGESQILKKGTQVIITQELGGDFTVRTDQGLFRIAGQDADALGRPPPPLDREAPSSRPFDEQTVWDQLRKCFDPEIPVNIVDLGLVYNCALEDDPDSDGVRVRITMTLTAPGCGMGQVLADDVKKKVEVLPEVSDAVVDLVFDPPWDPSRMTDAARLQAGLW